MSTLIVMAVVAVLFVVYGLLRSRDAAGCVGGSCAICSGSCHRNSQPDEVRDAS